ncbi:MAG TPA: DNA-binding domain-containing protein [bacterium]|nr:DNA-binding domain-containing protein [bacterium]
MSLDDSQKEFIRFLYAPRPDPGQKARVREMFLREDKPDPGNGMKVYRNNLVFGILQALQDTYGFTRALLGANNFNFLGREYLYANPSRHSDLTVYGGGFGDFLAGRAEVAAWPFLADVARLEWARDRAFYAPPQEAPRFFPAKLQPGTSLQIRRSLTLIQSPYGLLEPFELFKEKGLEALPEGPFKPGPEHLAVWAEGGEPRQRRVSSEVALVIRESRAGKNLEAIGELEPFGRAPQKLSEALLFLSDQGWVTGL